MGVVAVIFPVGPSGGYFHLSVETPSLGTFREWMGPRHHAGDSCRTLRPRLGAPVPLWWGNCRLPASLGGTAISEFGPGSAEPQSPSREHRTLAVPLMSSEPRTRDPWRREGPDLSL